MKIRGGRGTGSMDWVHGVVHRPGPWDGPWTSVHVLYTYQFIDLLKFETRPSSLLNFGTANYCCNFGSFVNKSDYIVKTY